MENLKKLWHTVFGDAPSIIDTYFDIFYAEELTAVEYADGQLAAAAYVMPAGYLINGSTREKCAHIYAVAVYPEYRGRGLGISVTNKAVELAKEHGYTAVILHPAGDGLFGFYEKHCGFETCFSADFCETTPPRSSSFTEADIDTYLAKREQLLTDIPHVELSCDILSFFKKCGGKLYVADQGCAAAEIIARTVYLREFLGDPAEIPHSNAEKCIICTPGAGTATGMIHGNPSIKGGWIGLTLE